MRTVKQLIIALLLLIPMPAHALETDAMSKLAKEALYNDLTANLACRCGCGTTLKTCPHENCSFAVPARKEILGFIDQGLGRGEIKAKMVAHHGEAILAMPMFSGFGVLGWVMPFAAILAVGYMVALIVRKWALPSTSISAKVEKTSGDSISDSDPYLNKIREELKKLGD
jgi:cytochrome c-type biogenesis protein CcmH/NrfF